MNSLINIPDNITANAQVNIKFDSQSLIMLGIVILIVAVLILLASKFLK